MLSHLSIKNLTLVNALDLDFSGGMSVVTGETGAGKSIMLEALGLAIGDRAGGSLIAPGAERAEISATFEVPQASGEARQWLRDRALDTGALDGALNGALNGAPDGGDICILRRVLTADGRSRAFVNGSPVTIADLRTLGESLLDIHSQREHQRLLKRESHRTLLDGFGGLHPQVAALNEQYDAFAATQGELEHLVNSRDEQDARTQLLAYQSGELSELAVADGECGALEAEQKRLANAGENRQKIAEVVAICNGDEDGVASDLLNRALSRLGEVDDDSVKAAKEMLSTAAIQVEEAANDLAAVMGRFESDPERLFQVEERLGKIHDMARKHKVNPDALPALAERISRELRDTENVHQRIAALEERLGDIRASYDGLAADLARARRKAAKELEREVTRHLQDLGMSGARFNIQIQPSGGAGKEPRRFGMDDIEFLVATIPGAAPGSLGKIASGGELSRISLAIQVVTAQTSATPTLVFDEVDVGVGGATAEVVGNLLRRLGEETQVLCVTHLPQVAAQGHHHYAVAKLTTDSGATATVRQLDEAAKVSEIARMLGGVEQTAESLAHAESMRAVMGSGN